MRFDILTLFPDLFTSYLQQSLLKQALQRGLVEVHLWNIRDWATDRHRSVDAPPYGGGPGMLMMCPPVFACVEHVRRQAVDPGVLVMLTPAGKRLNQTLVAELAQQRRLLLLCGRYEGFDERIALGLKPLEISIGDFVTNGGEVPAMLIMDSVIRLVPGVIGDRASLISESFSEGDLLEYPQYTRPRQFRGMHVPDVLLSGNHQAIAEWRRQWSELRTRQRSREETLPHRPESASETLPTSNASCVLD